jgi:hypothetical protein
MKSESSSEPQKTSYSSKQLHLKCLKTFSSTFKYGKLQVKVGLAALLLHYEFIKCYKTKVCPELNTWTWITSPANGMWLRIHTIKLHQDQEPISLPTEKISFKGHCQCKICCLEMEVCN